MAMGWWNDPYKWVDANDILQGGELRVGRAIAVLTDTLVTRPTDKAVMVEGVVAAVKTAGLTRRQGAALEVARAAGEQSATMAVAQALGINRHSAYKLLQRAGAITPKRKMETSDSFFHIAYKERVSETMIRQTMERMKIECVACGAAGCSPRYGLCRRCWDEYGAPDKRTEMTRKWLDPLVRIAWNQARKDAIETLHRADWDDDERQNSA